MQWADFRRWKVNCQPTLGRYRFNYVSKMCSGHCIIHISRVSLDSLIQIESGVYQLCLCLLLSKNGIVYDDDCTGLPWKDNSKPG